MTLCRFPPCEKGVPQKPYRGCCSREHYWANLILEQASHGKKPYRDLVFYPDRQLILELASELRKVGQRR